MSFYEESSIIITPNAYKAGTLYAVVPTSGLADMDVTRATAATRVDESGLVNYALGVEEVTNGDFSNGSTDWTPFGSTFVVSNANPYNGNDTALFTASGVNGAKVTQSITTVVGNTYHLSCYAQYNSGDQTQIEIEGVLEYPNGIGVNSGVTTFTFLQTSFTATSTTSVVAIRERGGNNNASCYLYDISVKEVNNVPRIDYTGGGCPHILAEPQRTNLITYSEDFSQWGTQDKIILTPNSVSSLSGDVNAYKIIPTSTSGVHKVRENLSTVSGDYTLSIFAKQGEYKNILLWDDILSGGLGVNLDDLSIFRNQNNQSYNIEDYGSGWVRISVTLSYSSQQILPSLYIYDNSATPKISFAGNDIDGLYIWGSQIEQGSYATSYIPTSGSTVTRNKDVFTKDGISSLINSEEGVLFVEIAALSDDSTFRGISISDGTYSNRCVLRYGGASNRLNVLVSSGGSIVFDSLSILSNIKNFSKIAVKWKANDFAFWVNDVEVATSTSGNAPIGLSQLQFADSINSSSFFYGKVKQLQVYPTALSDSELTSLTTP